MHLPEPRDDRLRAVARNHPNGGRPRMGEPQPFDELLALGTAIEGISDFVPFSSVVQDPLVGRWSPQITDVTEQLSRF
nr:hypothetical protein [uncultured Actinoplanes sp.]